ncbi:transient receptor potential cation channel subfamily M member-like 2 isoform X2 [Ptychodera flava]|uniref:transient receptor potential cation channel subfamily M member-like 2 isoform X2 n=1 Tax=Ptychodera flava TaxID=63121 RepID=UPI00396A2DDC
MDVNRGEEGEILMSEINVSTSVNDVQQLKKCCKALRENNVDDIGGILCNFDWEEITLEDFKAHLGKLYCYVLSQDCPPWLEYLKIHIEMEDGNNRSNGTKQHVESPILQWIGKFICKLLPMQYPKRKHLGNVYKSWKRHESKMNIGTLLLRKFIPDLKDFYPARDLFLWALISNRQVIALKILKTGWKSTEIAAIIGACLTGYGLLNQLAARIVHDSPALSSELGDTAHLYESIALHATRVCFDERQIHTQSMLIRYRREWGKESSLVKSSCLTAEKNPRKNIFVQLLNETWAGGMKYEEKYFHVRILIALLPIFACVLKLKEDTPWYRYDKRWQAYYTAPIFKFTLYVLVYLFIIVSVSNFLMTHFHHVENWRHVSLNEKIAFLMMVGMTVEEFLYSCLYSSHLSKWNTVDWTIISLYALGVILRFTLDADHLHWTKFVFCLALIAMYTRLIQFSAIHRYMGKKVSMIQMMLVPDLPPFIFIFCVFVVGFGVTYHAFLYPNEAISLKSSLEMLGLSYWQLYGEIQLEEITDVEATRTNPYMLQMLTAVYMLISNILLLNLLIAVFNQGYTEIAKKSSEVAGYIECFLVEEYLAFPILPIPFNVLEWLIIRPMVWIIYGLWVRLQDKKPNSQYFWTLGKVIMFGKVLMPTLSESVKTSLDDSWPIGKSTSRENIDRFIDLTMKNRRKSQIVLEKTEELDQTLPDTQTMVRVSKITSL